MSSAWHPGREPATVPDIVPLRTATAQGPLRARDLRTAAAPAPTIVGTVTAVPAYSATQDEVKTRLRALFDLPTRRLDAAMELFDHAAVERRYSVEPVERLGVPRPLGEIQDRYREHA